MINMMNGGDIILAGMFGTTFSQAGAVAGIWRKTKDEKIKGLSPAAFISAMAGVTEPAIYGLTLPKKEPFIRSCIISGIAGGILGIFGVKAYSMAGMGVFGYTAYIDVANGNNMSGMFVAIAVSVVCLVAGFVAETIFYKDEPAKSSGQEKVLTLNDSQEVASPLDGNIVPLSEVKDEAFSSGMMGQGIAIEPATGKLYAPCDGEIMTFFPTGHAVGIVSNTGAEILIHVGMDTVNLNGEGFTPRKKQGDTVKKGDLLLEFDIDRIKSAGYSLVTPVIITNTDAYASVKPTEQSEIKAGEVLLYLK